MKRASKLFVISLVAIVIGAALNDQEGGVSMGDTILSVMSAVIAGLAAYNAHREMEKAEKQH